MVYFQFFSQMKIALEWLRGERVEYRRFAAVLILKVSAASWMSIWHVCFFISNFKVIVLLLTIVELLCFCKHLPSLHQGIQV